MRLGIAAPIVTFTIDSAWARTGVATNGSCATSGYTCQSVDCCGIATPKSGTTTKTICQTANMTTWVDGSNGNAEYYFACNTEDKALALVSGAALAVSSLASMVLY